MAIVSHLFQPRPYQIPLLKAFDNGKRRLVHVWHRRCGKDLLDLNITIAEMAKTVGNYYYFLPTYTQAKRVIWEGKTNDGIKFLDFFPPQLLDGKPNDTELKVKFKNGSLFQLIGTDNIDAIVGTNPIGCVFSEFSLQDKRAWEFIRPILAANGGWAIFNGTPRGKNHLWQTLQIAQDDPERWFSEILTVDNTNVFTHQSLEEEKKQMPQDLFEQEYYCKFLDGAGQFFRRIHENTYEPTGILTEDGDFQIGVDLAKYQDWTVITPFNLNTMVAYPQDRFNQVDWNLQKSRIEATWLRYRGVVVPDSTGVGDPIVEDLKNKGVDIYGEEGEGFKFSERSRENLLRNLAILLEQDKIRIPNDPGLIGELESFRYELSDRGKVKIGVPEGLHDDRVMSLALAVWGVTEPVKPDFYRQYAIEQNRASKPTRYR